MMAVRIQGMTPLLQAFDMPTSLKFYCDVLGFEIVQTDTKTAAPHHNWVWLRLNDTDPRTNTTSARRRPTRAGSRATATSHGSLFFGAPDMDAIYAHLRGNGIEVKEPTVAPYGMKQLYVRDPDGFDLCFQWKAQD
jgi:glyoxylase I family protein